MSIRQIDREGQPIDFVLLGIRNMGKEISLSEKKKWLSASWALESNDPMKVEKL